MKGALRFNGGRGGVFFRSGASFLSGGCTLLGGASVLMGRFSKKKRRMGGGVPHPMPPTPVVRS